jgi:hypothetical protein
VEYLEEVLLEVESHVENERFGADIAEEIDVVMAYIGGVSYEDDTRGVTGGSEEA